MINVQSCLEVAPSIFKLMFCIKLDCFNDAFVNVMLSLVVHC